MIFLGEMRGWSDKFSLFNMPGVEEEYLQNRTYPYKEVRVTLDISSNFWWFFNRSTKSHTTNTNLVLAKTFARCRGCQTSYYWYVIHQQDTPSQWTRFSTNWLRYIWQGVAFQLSHSSNGDGQNTGAEGEGYFQIKVVGMLVVSLYTKLGNCRFWSHLGSEANIFCRKGIAYGGA